MLVGVLLYAYAIGERSAHTIKQRYSADVAIRVLAGNLTPDHVMVCRFRSEHQDALAGLCGYVLPLCANAEVVSALTIPVDSTRVAATRDGSDGRR